jgi:hypothetical protein
MEPRERVSRVMPGAFFETFTWSEILIVCGLAISLVFMINVATRSTIISLPPSSGVVDPWTLEKRISVLQELQSVAPEPGTTVMTVDDRLTILQRLKEGENVASDTQ